MTKITSSLLTLASLLALGLGLLPAQALNTRSFISANGLDTNACTRTAPCRTLQKAHDSTNPGGEINMLDPAGYGTVTITKAISIVNDGVGSAGVLVPSGGTGITINAGASDKINLRGLIIEGAGVGQTGISFHTGRYLTIDDCVVRNLTGGGLNLFPQANSTLSISNTYVANIANGFANSSILVQGGSGAVVTAVFNRVETYNNGGNGIALLNFANTGSIRATIVDSVSAHNGSDGFTAVTNGSGSTVTVSVIRSTAAHNGNAGIRTQGLGASMLVGQSVASQNLNVNAAAVVSALMFSYGDNYFDGAGCSGCAGVSKQ